MSLMSLIHLVPYPYPYFNPNPLTGTSYNMVQNIIDWALSHIERLFIAGRDTWMVY